MARRDFDIYRGVVLTLPGVSTLAFGVVVAEIWHPGGMAVIAAGVVVFLLGAVVGSRGGTRWVWLYPLPIRELEGKRPIWSPDHDDNPPEPHPAFVEHVHWLRCMRAKLDGGEPTRPLGRAGHLAAEQGGEASAVQPTASPNPDPAPAGPSRPSASLWSDDLAATREADAEVAARTARPRSPKGLMLRASGRRPAPDASETEH